MRIYCHKFCIALLFFLMLFIFVKLNIFSVISSNAYAFEVKLISNRILNHVSNYIIEESAYTKVYYTKSDVDYISLICSTVDFYYPLISNDFNSDVLKKATIVVYPNEELLSSALGLDIVGNTMGIYYGGMLNILSPTFWVHGENEAERKDNFLNDGPLIHELAHFILDNKTNGNYPLWFTEGVALYYEHKYTGFEWRSDLKNYNSVVSFHDLTYNFRQQDEALAYRRCFDIINYIVINKGEESLQKLIEYMACGFSFHDSFEKLYNQPPDVIDTISF